jgi:hypothetical protein
MRKEHTYVDCAWCLSWDEEKRTKQVCYSCDGTRKVINPKGQLCNLCGGDMCYTFFNPYSPETKLPEVEQKPNGLYNAQVRGGYYTPGYLLDMNRYTFSFCEKCLRQLFMQCKIKPIVDGMDFYDNIREADCWEDDQRQYEYQEWKKDGGHHKAYLDRKCNSRKDCPNKAIYTIMCNDEFSEDSTCEEHKRKEGGSYSLVQFIRHELKAFL